MSTGKPKGVSQLRQSMGVDGAIVSQKNPSILTGLEVIGQLEESYRSFI